jgi:SNF2 family DNA or RNA helicase
VPHPNGGYVVVPRERIEPLVDLLLELAAEPDEMSRRLSRLRAMDLAAVLRSEQGALAAMRALREQLTSPSAAPLRLPKRLLADLRPYQLEGTSWLWRLHRAGLGAVLADDMGLGKTLQVIALLCLLRERKDRRPSLIVAPTSVLLSWGDQLQAFAPHLDVVVWHGAGRTQERARLDTADVVLTTYTLLHRDADDLVGRAWDLCVLDEAQTIKNAKTVFWERARSLDARQRIAVTGTPMENHLGELWSIVSFAIPGALGSERAFRAAYRSPIEKQHDPGALASLRRRLAPVLLRRTKEQVASELPSKTVIEHLIELTEGQRDIYEAVRQTTLKAVRDAIASRGFGRSRIIVLDALLKLRQICCDPRLLKSRVAKRAERSAKLDAFADLVTTLVDEGRRTLVFSQFVEMLGRIGERLDALGIPYLVLTGATVNRRAVVDMFRKGTVPVFLISLKAGGTGLNLVEADTVIHYDPWWNPAVEAQATDRAHRIGQSRPVFVHKLITRSTVEQKIVELQRAKAALARGLLEGSFDAPLLDEATVDALLAPLPQVARGA